MKLLLVCTLFGAATARGTVALSFSDCGDASTHGKIGDVEPRLITMGTTTKVTGTGTVDEAVASGTFTAQVATGPVRFSWSGDLCSRSVKKLPLGLGEITFDGVQCPHASGPVSLSLDVTLSKFIPTSLAKATIEVTAVSTTGDKLLCAEIQVEQAEDLELQANQRLDFGSATQGGTVALDFSDCGDASTHGKLADVEPRLLTMGTTTKVTGTGTVDELVTSGTFTAQVATGPVQVSWSGDLCSHSVKKLPLGLGEITFDGVQCPHASGPVSLSLDVTLSKFIPARLAKSTIELSAVSTTGDKLLCAKIQTKHAEEREFETTQNEFLA